MFTKIGLSMVAFVFILTGAFCSPVWAGSSINIGNGNLRHTQPLFQIPYGKLLESFTLTYNSLDGSDTRLGTGWTHVLNIRLSLNNDGTYTIYEGDGRKIVLYKNGGRYTPEKSKV